MSRGLNKLQGARPVSNPCLVDPRRFSGIWAIPAAVHLGVLMPRVPAQPTGPSQPAPPPGTPSPGDRTSVPEQLSMGLEAAIARFGALVRRVAWRHKLDGDDLEEVLQDVRLRLWRARGDSEQLATVSASYVYRTAASAALDLIRRRRRAREVPLAPTGVQENVDDTADDIASGSVGHGNPEASLEAAELGRAITKAIEQIVPSRRAVVRMYLIGHPPMEIANLMGWTEPKTRNLLYRGLADLRSQLTAMGYNPGAGGD